METLDITQQAFNAMELSGTVQDDPMNEFEWSEDKKQVSFLHFCFKSLIFFLYSPERHLIL